MLPVVRKVLWCTLVCLGFAPHFAVCLQRYISSNEDGIRSDRVEGGNCWHQPWEHWIELDADWYNRTSAAAGHWTKSSVVLPVLEPMRLDESRPPGYDIFYKSKHHLLDHYPVMKISVPYASMARLPCPVRQLGNRTVSWMKHDTDSVELLTVGNGTYSSDGRLAVAWRYPGNWTLQITPVELDDGGCYQCQVNTHPPISLFIHLEVRGPAVTIVDDRNVSIREAVFKQGALIRLVCLVRQAAGRDNFPVLWQLGTAIFNHDTQRGGVSIKTERHGRDAVSWLLMVRATTRDSGQYTCSVDNKAEASVSVHVIQGEHQAAVQELTTSSTISSTKEPIDLICFVLFGSILHYRLSFIDYRPITVAMYHVLNLLFRAVSLTYLLVLDKYRIILSL